MKEFVEKLISRFEEKIQENIEECKDRTDLLCHDRNFGIRQSMAIANELAEEYEPCIKSCTDCEAYDLVKHNCPKFCKVIRETVEEIKENYNNSWILCSERLPNKEECLKNDGRFIVTDGNRTYQSIYDIYESRFKTLVIRVSGWSYKEDKCAIAWQPLPQPYKKGSGENE